MRTLIAAFAAIALSASSFAGTLAVTSHSPSMAAGPAPSGSSIVLNFNLPLNPATITSSNIWAFGRMSGTVVGPLTLSNANQTVTLNPASNFYAGEIVTIFISKFLAAADGSPIRPAGYSFQFPVRVRPSAGNFVPHDVLTTNIRGESSRPYGGVACDWDHDGWLDVTMVNEDTHDLRVFINAADGQGTYNPVLTPTSPIGVEGSPNDSSDFNRDGNPDMCVANYSGNSVSIVLGNGDGSFQPQQLVPLAGICVGITTLDVDGDADTDIAVCNLSANNLSILTNNGAGVFSVTSSFNAGVNGERSLGSADMNNDGIIDLVVGGINDGTIRVLTGNGNSTFTQQPLASAGGPTWMLVVADVNGDGNVDVSSANSSDSEGAILFGNGAGGLSAPTIYPTTPSCIATDFLDFEGDGDIDWALSSFSGDWELLENNGAGVFTSILFIPPPVSASCALGFDIDNDRDLDLGLVDEIDDTLTIYKNGNSRCPADIAPALSFGDGNINIDDLTVIILAWNTADISADITDDGTVNIDDLTAVILAWGSCP